jgi:hypothetical protein
MPQSKERRQLAAPLGFVAQQNFRQERQQKVAILESALQQVQHEGF